MNFLILSISSIAVLTLYIVSFYFRFYIHPIISLITHGVTGGKTYFFLIYSSISFLILFLSKKKTKPSMNKEGLWQEWLFFIAISSGMASSIGSYLYYAYKYSLSLQAYHYHFKEIYNSVNYLPHIHTSKLYLFMAGRILGIEQLLAGMDDGRVFQGSIPLFFPMATLISIILVIFLSFFLIKKIVFDWDERYQLGVSIISVISFNSIIKTMSDGGAFAYDFLVASCVVYIISVSKNPEEVITSVKKKWRIIFWVFFSVFSLMCLIDPTFGILTYTIKNSLNVFMVYFAIFFITIRDTMSKKWRLFFVIFLSIFFSYTLYVRFVVYIEPFQIYLEKGTKINYFYYRDRPLPKLLKNANIISKTEFFDLYSITIEKNIKPLEIYRALGENPYRNRHVAIVLPKKRQAYGIISDILFINFKHKNTSLKVPKIIHLKLTKKDSHYEKFDAEIAFDPVYFPALSQVEEGRVTQLDENHKFLMYYFLNRLFFHYGINEFIFTPYAFYRFN